MPQFERYIGVDYSGAETAEAGLPGLRVYDATIDKNPLEVPPTVSRPKHWTRKGVANWLVDQLSNGPPALVGIDHGFSFPSEYFLAYDLPFDWPYFLEDFQSHWPTDEPNTYVDFVRDGVCGSGAWRTGKPTWRRIVEKRCRAKSVFHFDVQGSVAKSTHSGIPWLRFIRKHTPSRIHFWPFDGWEIPPGSSAIAEVYPALWNRSFSQDNRNSHQHDAWCISTWLRDVDRNGSLATFLAPSLSEEERAAVKAEGWILGVP